MQLPLTHEQPGSAGRRWYALGALAAATVAAAGVAIPAAPALAGPPEVPVTSTEHLLAGEPFHQVDVLSCPAGTNRTTERFSDNPGVPHSLEVIQSNPNPAFGIDVHPVMDLDGLLLFESRTSVGGFGSTVSNWFGAAQTVTFILHCH